MITTKDIAKQLNISVSTVGRALSDDPRISVETRRRVQEVAKSIGYVTNRAARMLRGSKSNLVALMVPDVRHGFYSKIAHALSECLERENFILTLSETGDRPDRELQHLRGLAGSQIAGVILVPTMHPHADTIKILKSIPHVQLVRRHASLGGQSFGIDFARAVEDATRHLLQLGHRHIGYIGAHDQLFTSMDRLNGFRTALAAFSAKGTEQIGEPANRDWSAEAIRQILRSRPRPTAVVLSSVRITYDVLRELRASGVAVPEELSVVGFGDEPGFEWWGPGLTTVDLPISDLSTACGLWFLHHRLQNADTASYGAFTNLSAPSMLIRGSTAEIKKASASARRKGV